MGICVRSIVVLPGSVINCIVGLISVYFLVYGICIGSISLSKSLYLIVRFCGIEFSRNIQYDK